jgi:hypothetical protein
MPLRRAWMVGKRTRRLVLSGIMTLLALALAAPAFAYTNVNVTHIRLTRLDPVQCSSPIRISALLVGTRNVAVPGVLVQFTLHLGQAGDVVTPTSVVSGADGRAQTTLSLSCRSGERVVRASIAGGAQATISLSCGQRQGCTIGKNASQVGTGVGSAPDGGVASLDMISAAATEPFPVSPAATPLAVLLGLAVAAWMVRQVRRLGILGRLLGTLTRG